MKDSYVLDFQSLKHDSSIMGASPKVELQKKGNVFFIGEYGDLCLDLKLENYNVQNVEEIKEGINLLLKNADTPQQLPDVIIISKKITQCSIETIKSLKKSDRLMEIPVIIIAEKFDEDERDLAIKVGAEDYYTENISAKYLSLRIEFLTRLKSLSNDLEKEAGKTPQPSLHNNDSFRMWSLKRAFDILVSATLLLIISPVLLLIAIAIKLDSKGPIFYISKRAGKGYQIFNFYKFRSMRQDADSIVEELKHLNQYNANGDDALFFKVKNDPRITRLGSFLRKTSLDELPQLFNVLKGDMSLVGNRPLPLYEAEKLTQDQWALRFLAPAGITGLWQITKRGKEEMSESERVALDMEYAKKNSFWYDMKIMLKTPTALLQSEEV